MIFPASLNCSEYEAKASCQWLSWNSFTEITRWKDDGCFALRFSSTLFSSEFSDYFMIWVNFDQQDNQNGLSKEISLLKLIKQARIMFVRGGLSEQSDMLETTMSRNESSWFFDQC